MEIKRSPEDFAVEELTDRKPARGPFALYRLEKRGLGTLEAVEAVARELGLPSRAIAYGGLKDRRAVTCQHLTIRNGPRRALRREAFRLEYLGQTDAPFSPADIQGNRFRIVLRSLAPERLGAIREAVADLATSGFPNYFGEQRFGSLGESGVFIALPWCRGEYEQALRLALAEPNRRDTPQEAEEKALLRAHWGDWPAAKAKLSRSHRRSVVTYLADHPRDFRRAFALIRADLRGLYLAAFQSRLWNRCLARRVAGLFPPDRLFESEIAGESVPFFIQAGRAAVETLAAAPLPLPSARLKLEAGPVRDLLWRVADEAGLALREIRVKYPRDSFFSKGWRATTARPEGLSLEELGGARATLTFSLPRGSYATVLLARLEAR